MSVKSTHPDYDRLINNWTIVRDCYEGEEEVKSKGTVYLPATDSMIIDGMNTGELGLERYKAYVSRAVFPDYVTEAIEKMVSAINKKEPTIELPDKMKYLIKSASVNGEPLVDLIRRVNFEQLLTGRLGLLPDFQEKTTNPEPKIALYSAESIINWYAPVMGDLKVVVLDESGNEMDATKFTWDKVDHFRVLYLNDAGNYAVGIVEGDNDIDVESLNEPSLRGNKLKKIPFTFVNASDMTAEPGAIPMLGLSRLCLTIYRGEADYRRHLFMQSEDTLVIKGQIDDPEHEDGDPIRTGSGARINVETDGDAKFIGVNASGLSEQRISLENDKKLAETKTIMFSAGSFNSNQSGEALKTRIAAQTVSLVQISQAGAAAVESSLKDIAIWMNLNPDEVSVTANIDFDSLDFNATDLKTLMTAKAMEAPISEQSIHGLMVEKGFTKMSYEDEKAIIELERGVIEENTGDDDGLGNFQEEEVEDEEA